MIKRCVSVPFHNSCLKLRRLVNRNPYQSSQFAHVVCTLTFWIILAVPNSFDENIKNINSSEDYLHNQVQLCRKWYCQAINTVLFMRCEPDVSEHRWYDNSWFTLVMGRSCPLKSSPFGVPALGPTPLPLLEASLKCLSCPARHMTELESLWYPGVFIPLPGFSSLVTGRSYKGLGHMSGEGNHCHIVFS
jgi:hypothetical protein